MKNRFVCALALVAGLLVSANAQASTFLQFQQLTFNNPFVLTQNATQTGTTITAVNVPVNVIFDQTFCIAVGCSGATNGTYLFNLTANSTSAATSNGTDISQNYAGVLSFTSGAINLLTVNFSDLFSGGIGGSSPTLGASQPPDTFSGTSTVFDPLKLGIPRGFSISLSDLARIGAPGGLAIVGTTIASANADGTGTFNATPVVVQAEVPEPASMFLLGTGLIGLAANRRRRKAAK